MVESEPLPPLPADAGPEKRAAQYAAVLERMQLLLAGEDDWVSAQATVACELHSAFSWSWTGFYRNTAAAAEAAAAAAAAAAVAAGSSRPTAVAAGQQRDAAALAEGQPSASAAASAAAGERTGMLAVGPYQGALGCLRIPFDRGVCGAAARTRQLQLVPDVHAFPGHIACASSTQSEVVVPVLTPDGRLLAVLDIDSDLPAAFDCTDAQWLQKLCDDLGARQWRHGL